MTQRSLLDAPQPIDPYEILCRCDTAMRYAAHDPERFLELCIQREVIADAMDAIAQSVGRFFRMESR